jgi:hypothetical protein
MQTLFALEANPIVGACGGLGVDKILEMCPKADPFAFHSPIGSGFQAACSRGDDLAPSVIGALCALGPIPAELGFDPFEAAAGHATNIRALLAAGLLPEPETGALVRAACVDNVDSLRVLLGAAGLSPNHRSKSGESALCIAARHGSLRALQELLEAGADPLLQIIPGDSLLPIHYAARMSQTRALGILVGKGGLDIESRQGLPLEVAALHCMGERGLEAFELLMAATHPETAAAVAPRLVEKLSEHLSGRPEGARGEHWLWKHFEYAHRRLQIFLVEREARIFDEHASAGKIDAAAAWRL